MKYNVKIADTIYEVEIEDIHTQPVIAYVNGERVEVHPEAERTTNILKEPDEIKTVGTPHLSTTPPGNLHELTAPLPGTIVEIFVKPGELVETGKIVLIIEAMKMKNSIRSTRSGKVAELLVNAGQTVTHKQPLVRFE